MVSIRKIIPTFIITPIFIAIGLTGWLAFYRGKQSVEMLVVELNQRTVEDIESQVRTYLDRPQLIHQLTLGTIRSNSLNPQSLNDLERYLWHQVIWDDQLNYSYYGNEAGEFIGIQFTENNELQLHIRQGTSTSPRETYQLDNDRRRIEQLSSQEYDPRTRPWYQVAKTSGEPTWSPIYHFASQNSLGITAVAPLYESEGTLTGVLGIDISLAELSRILEDMDLSPNGVAFIMERSGHLVSSSLPVHGRGDNNSDDNSDDNNNSSTPSTRPNALATTSPNSTIQGTADALNRQFNSLNDITGLKNFTFSLNGEQQWVAVKPIQDGRGLDWLVVTLIPETDVMGYIYANTRYTLVLLVIFIIAAALLGLAIANWLIQPILKLSSVAQDIEFGQFDPDRLDDVSDHSQEMGQLARVFNSMASTIYTRQQGLQEQLTILDSQTHQAKKAMLLHQGDDPQVFRALLLKAKRALSRADDLKQVNLAESLKTIPYFETFNDSDIHQLLEMGHQEVFYPGDYICHEDEPGDAFFVILHGSVDVFVAKLDKCLTQLQAGDFFGELSLLLGIPRTATVRTREDTLVFVLDRQGLQELLQQYPDLAEAIAQALQDHQAELASRQDQLRDLGLLDDPSQFNDTPLAWIRERMAALFKLPLKS